MARKRMRSPHDEANQLGEKLWRSVEAEQGYAFISDGITALADNETVLSVARGALKHTRRVERILVKFLAEYDRAPKASRRPRKGAPHDN